MDMQHLEMDTGMLNLEMDTHNFSLPYFIKISNDRIGVSLSSIFTPGLAPDALVHLQHVVGTHVVCFVTMKAQLHRHVQETW